MPFFRVAFVKRYWVRHSKNVFEGAVFSSPKHIRNADLLHQALFVELVQGFAGQWGFSNR